MNLRKILDNDLDKWEVNWPEKEAHKEALQKAYPKLAKMLERFYELIGEMSIAYEEGGEYAEDAVGKIYVRAEKLMNRMVAQTGQSKVESLARKLKDRLLA